jgi:hypothetical protein
MDDFMVKPITPNAMRVVLSRAASAGTSCGRGVSLRAERALHSRRTSPLLEQN